jgi:DNA-binding response OmpR family regulator
MLRRPRGQRHGQPEEDVPAVRQIGELVIDEGRHEITQDGSPLPLTAREFTLLTELASQPGRVFTRGQLLERVWGTEYYDEHVVDMHIANLRHKLSDDPAHPRFIETVRGVGYRFGGRQV